MRTLAILPVKSFPNAKQRLRRGLDRELRSRLAETMLQDVLDALGTAAVNGVIVVTAGEPARALAEEQGAHVVADAEQGHNLAAALGIEEARRLGADRALLVPGDCPALDPAELNALLARPMPDRSVVIIPDRHATGTTALLIRPPDALAPAFGPGSCRRHAALAREAGVTCEIVPVPSLALDIDTPEDLAALGELSDRGLRTHELLSRC